MALLFTNSTPATGEGVAVKLGSTPLPIPPHQLLFFSVTPIVHLFTHSRFPRSYQYNMAGPKQAILSRGLAANFAYGCVVCESFVS